MNKSFSLGKLIGIVFCIIAAAGTIALLFVNAYFSGQMKLIDKCFTAIERDDYESFRACFSSEDKESITEEYFSLSREILSVFQDNEDNKTNVRFVSREKFDENLYFLTFNLTVYNDNEHREIEISSLAIAREKGKWVLVM